MALFPGVCSNRRGHQEADRAASRQRVALHRPTEHSQASLEVRVSIRFSCYASLELRDWVSIRVSRYASLEVKDWVRVCSRCNVHHPHELFL